MSFEANQPISHHDFHEGVDFYGRLITYSTARVGRLIGGASIRALCLTFDGVTLLPYFDTLRDEDLLYTPAFAVASIEQI